jgi:hypothetical protein
MSFDLRKNKIAYDDDCRLYSLVCASHVCYMCSKDFQLSLIVQITTLLNDISQIYCWKIETHIYMKTECLQTKWIQHHLGWKRKKVVLIKRVKLACKLEEVFGRLFIKSGPEKCELLVWMWNLEWVGGLNYALKTQKSTCFNA